MQEPGVYQVPNESQTNFSHIQAMNRLNGSGSFKSPTSSKKQSKTSLSRGRAMAQQRIRDKFEQEENAGKVQHLRNPMTVAQQLKKHLMLQRNAQKNKFNAIIGQAGQKALQKINKPTIQQPPLRFQSNNAPVCKPINQRARSASTGLRRKKRLTNLRLAPNMLNSRTSHSPVHIAHHGPVNILVSQRPMASNRNQISTINHSSRIGQQSVKNTITPSSVGNRNQQAAKSRGATLNDISRSSLAHSNALSPAFDDNSLRKAKIPAYQETMPLSSSNRALLDKIMSQRRTQQDSSKPLRKKSLSRKSKSQPYLSSHPSSQRVS